MRRMRFVGLLLVYARGRTNLPYGPRQQQMKLLRYDFFLYWHLIFLFFFLLNVIHLQFCGCINHIFSPSKYALIVICSDLFLYTVLQSLFSA